MNPAIQEPSRDFSALDYSGLRVKDRPEPEPNPPEKTPPAPPPAAPVKHPPEWKARQAQCRVYGDPHSGKWGRVAELCFVADANQDRPLLIEDRTGELFTDPVLTAVRVAVDSTEAAKYLGKLWPQMTDAQKRKKLASAHLVRLRGEREALVIAAEGGLAKKLQSVDAKISTEQTKLDEADRDIGTLAPLIDKALAAAEAHIKPAYNEAWRAALLNHENRRAAVLQRIEEAVGPLLTELLILQKAHESNYGLYTTVTAELARRLRGGEATQATETSQ